MKTTSERSHVYNTAEPTKKKFDSGWSRMYFMLLIFYKHVNPPGSGPSNNLL